VCRATRPMDAPATVGASGERRRGTDTVGMRLCACALVRGGGAGPRGGKYRTATAIEAGVNTCRRAVAGTALAACTDTHTHRGGGGGGYMRKGLTRRGVRATCSCRESPARGRTRRRDDSSGRRATVALSARSSEAMHTAPAGSTSTARRSPLRSGARVCPKGRAQRKKARLASEIPEPQMLRFNAATT